MKRRDDLQNELENIAPKLAAHASTNPFAVPDNYFDALPQQTLAHVKRMNALVESLQHETNASTNPFETPRGYFNELPDRVLQRVTSQPIMVALKPNRWKNYLSIAAAVAALFLVSVPMLRNAHTGAASTNPVVKNITMEQVTNDELYNYLTSDVAAVHDEEIAEHVSDAALDTLEQQMLSAHVNSSYDDALLDVTNMDLDLIESL